MGELSKLPNVGKVLEGLLQKAGIATPEELRQVGTQEAFRRIRLLDPTACVHMLYGVEGALEGIPDKLLTPETKAQLKAFHKELEIQRKSNPA